MFFFQWFAFRDVYMSHVDKTEDHVSKLHREYQDHWHKYAELMERGEENIKASSTPPPSPPPSPSQTPYILHIISLPSGIWFTRL